MEKSIDDSVKQKLLDSLAEEPTVILSTAYAYAKNYVKHGEDITKAWTTTVQQASILEQVRQNAWVEAYDSFKKDYENHLKAEREKIAEDVANKMNYMGSCLNEKNIILGVITGKRETTDSLCSTCKSECCVSNGTAISKVDYEARLKADMVAMLTDIQLEIEEEQGTDYHGIVAVSKGSMINIIQEKIDKLKEQEDGNDD